MSDKKACYEKCMEENYSNPRKCDDSEGNCKEAAAKHCKQQCGGMDEDVKDFFKNRMTKQMLGEIANRGPIRKIESGPGSGKINPIGHKVTTHTIGKKFEVGNQTPQEKNAIQTSNSIAKKKGSGM